jgi:hypothetical protein
MRCSATLALLLLVGCSRGKQLEQCRYLVGGDGDLGACLVSRFNWDVSKARDAQVDYWIELKNAEAERRRRSEEDAAEEARAEAQRQRYRLLDRQGDNLFVFISPGLADDTANFRKFGEDLCGKQRPCIVHFWSAAPAEAFSVPLSPTLAGSQVAEYSADDSTVQVYKAKPGKTR